MNADLIFYIVLLAVAVFLFSVWKKGRAVAVAALSHPLRTNVIYLDSSGSTHIRAEGVSENGYRPQEAQEVSTEAVKETNKEEPKQYASLAK